MSDRYAEALPLMKHCGESNTNLACLELGESLEKSVKMTHIEESASDYIGLVLGGFVDVAKVGDSMKSGMIMHVPGSVCCDLRVEDIPNVSQLCMSNPTLESFAKVFVEAANISGFTLAGGNTLNKRSMGWWLDSVQSYTSLKRVNLSLVLARVTPFQSFCPASCLGIVALKIRGTMSFSIQTMTVLLQEQRQLQTLKLEVCCGQERGGAGDDGEVEQQHSHDGDGVERAHGPSIYSRLFADALQTHPSLSTLMNLVRNQTRQL